jgi:hypothetical protein
MEPEPPLGQWGHSAVSRLPWVPQVTGSGSASPLQQFCTWVSGRGAADGSGAGVTAPFWGAGGGADASLAPFCGHFVLVSVR